MIKKEQIERLEIVLKDFTNAVRLVDLTTRLMKAFIKQVEQDEERRRREGGEKK